MRKLFTLLAVLTLAAPLLFYGCSGDDGANGINGTNGTDGINGTDGTDGAPGAPGTARIADKHGEAALAAEELAAADKYMVDVAITGATADNAGLVTVDFTVRKSSDNTSVSTVPSVGAGIFKLAPAGGGLSYNKWVPYIWRSETVEDAAGNAFVMPAGTTVNQGYRESGATGGTLVNNGDGSYSYTFKKNLTAAARPDNVAIPYERNLTHRVIVTMGGHNGPTGEGDFDFVPDGSSVTATRNIVETATCKKCHGPEFAGHGGDRVTVEGCVACHSPDSKDAQSGESIEMAVMIHKLHAGNELDSVAGPDGQYYDNPWTVADETADNGEYILWGNQVRAVSWEGAAFPAVLANCVACHTQKVAGTLAQVDNWKAVPSRAACGSCHDLIEWVAGTNHGGGGATSDAGCAGCHPATGGPLSVTAAHNWTAKDERNIPEFDVELTTSAPANGKYYVNGESPVISIVLKDAVTKDIIVPNTVIEDSSSTPGGGAEGCTDPPDRNGTVCNVTRDGYFTSASIYVTGSRGQRIPVLTYPARAKVTSVGTGPWDLSGKFSLRVIVDSGMPMLMYNNKKEYEGYGADEQISGDIDFSRDPAEATADDNTYFNSFFVNKAAATPGEVANWLNDNPTFHERAIAYVDNTPNLGKLSIRSRGISMKSPGGEVVKNTAQPNIRVITSSVPADMFKAETFGAAGGAAQGRIRASASNFDPKANFDDPTAIRYYLDNVDNLAPGTYMINVEFADAGRGPGNDPEPPVFNYRTPSVAVHTFQVKQEAPEKPIAAGCTACHWSDAGVGFVLDYPRHNKIFNEQAVDQCGGCHDYASGTNSATFTAGTFGSGGHPISKRVHAVHNGSALNYPTITVAHEETAAFGRNWRITYPMNIRNCESCHPKDTTSGTWMTNPNRLACMGCHDSDAASTHMKQQTYDPTPLAPWSGDEKESCKTCH
jgi:hypothetical protein